MDTKPASSRTAGGKKGRPRADNPLERRTSGILLHLTSLPGPHGIGDLGPAAHRFVDFLADAGQSIWQMLPVGPPGGANSPYDSASSFAGSPLLLSLETLGEEGLLRAGEIPPAEPLPAERVDYGRAGRYKEERLRLAFGRFEEERARSPELERDLERFLDAASYWLEDYVLYRALEELGGGDTWTAWDTDLRRREPAALARARTSLDRQIRYQRFLQFEFDRQWKRLRTHAEAKRLALVGDVPFYVAHRSADVWAHQPLFDLDQEGRCRVVAGVPPDYFSKDGQLWGNPLYRWPMLRADGYRWWVERIRLCLRRFDAVRLDHFIGFHRAWAVPAGARTAEKGRWMRGPGTALFRKLREELGSTPLIAEDLGLVTDEVRALRDRLGLPGMRVLLFGFSGEPAENDFLPHRYVPGTVVYTGTHDNETMMGWFGQQEPTEERPSREQIQRERDLALAYTGSDGWSFHRDVLRLLLRSVANTVIFPLQDVLGLGNEARMNRPGTAAGNWTWRVSDEALTADLAAGLRETAALFGRIPRWDESTPPEA